MCYGITQECDNNIKRRSIFKGITLHNFNKGYSQSYSSSPFLITQQIIKCLAYIKRSKPFSYLLHNSMFLSNLYENIKQNLMFISRSIIFEKIMKNKFSKCYF
jgi:hypothetical protein